jgi:hypothetical protein
MGAVSAEGVEKRLVRLDERRDRRCWTLTLPRAAPARRCTSAASSDNRERRRHAAGSGNVVDRSDGDRNGRHSSSRFSDAKPVMLARS